MKMIEIWLILAFISTLNAYPSEESIQKAKDILDKYPVIDG